MELYIPYRSEVGVNAVRRGDIIRPPTRSSHDQSLLYGQTVHARKTRPHYMSSAILNLDKKDPFADDFSSEFGQGHYVHIRVQQRNSRKTLTTIQGLPDDLDLKRILKAFKKLFCCNGCIVEHPEHGMVLQLQGDHRVECERFLVDEQICSKEMIKLHGALA